MEVVRGRAALEAHRAAWERLVETALEANVFYEPFFLLPALEAFAHERPEVVLVYAQRRQNPGGERVLTGLFPVRRLGAGLAAGLWAHHYCFLTTPLVRRDHAAQTLGAFLDWLGTEAGALFRFPKLPGDGAFHRLLWTAVHAEQRPFWIQDHHLRAVFRPDESPAAFRQRSFPYSTRRELRRLRNKLARDGELTVGEVNGDVEGWVERFLTLEASGWKGRSGTAFRSKEPEERFFREVVGAAHAAGRLAMLSLELDGRPLAMNCAFRSAEGGFYFKIAHDEDYGRYSPGAVLEHEFVDWLHGQDGPRWLDSCADPAHPMIDRLWDERRAIQNLWIGTGRPGASLALGALPLARAARRSWKRWRSR